MPETSKEQRMFVGIDLAKRSFDLHGADERGARA